MSKNLVVAFHFGVITLCSEHHRVLEHQLFVMLLERFPKEAAILVRELYAPG